MEYDDVNSILPSLRNIFEHYTHHILPSHNLHHNLVFLQMEIKITEDLHNHTLINHNIF